MSSKSILSIFILIVQYLSFVSTTERYVLSFVNSSYALKAGLAEPMMDSFQIKQYGRRLVLGFSKSILVFAIPISQVHA
jgi:hypothetical protein